MLCLCQVFVAGDVLVLSVLDCLSAAGDVAYLRDWFLCLAVPGWYGMTCSCRVFVAGDVLVLLVLDCLSAAGDVAYLQDWVLLLVVPG